MYGVITFLQAIRKFHIADPKGGFDIVSILLGGLESKYFSYIILHHFECGFRYIYHTSLDIKDKFLDKRLWIPAPPLRFLS